MGLRRSRPHGIDLDDEAAKTLLHDHVKVLDVAKGKLFANGKSKHGHAPGWNDLFVHRHFLTDLVVLTKGQLLRMSKWEKQVGHVMSSTSTGKDWSRDDVSLVASRPRLMLSHLWRAKRDSLKMPRRFGQLQALVDAMNVRPRQMNEVSDDNDDDEDDDEDDNSVIVQETAASPAILVESGSEEEIDDIDALYATFFTPQRSSKVVHDYTPTPKSRSVLDVNEIAHMAAAGGTVPSETEYKETFKRPAASCKRPAASCKRQAPRGVIGDSGLCQAAIVDDTIMKYDDSVDVNVNKNRIYSIAYHTERDRCSRLGMSGTEARDRGCLFAAQAMEIFRQRYM